MKRIISILLLIATMLSAFSIVAFADDNATSGDGETGKAGEGNAWYNSYQYLWKVTLFVGKSDQASKQDNLTRDFHRIGTVIMKKTGWNVSSSVKFGSGTKVDYYDGVPMTLDTTPYIISDKNCPAVPIACGGDIETVKLYFGSTGTMNTILSGIADDKGTTKEAMLSALTFTIGGRTKSGWDYGYVDPNAETNRVPWVIVYEPMVIINLKDKVTKLALTATEFALCEINGWYDWNKSGGTGQNCAILPERHLPTSVQLDESWFGYPVYPVTNDSVKWDYQDVIKGGGWGMRWLSPAIKEPQGTEIDYGCEFGKVNTTPAIGGYGNVEMIFTNYKAEAGTVLVTLHRGYELVWSAWKTIPGGSSIKTSVVLYYESFTPQTLTCKINWSNRNDETDPEDNIDTVEVTPKRVTTTPTLDYGVFFREVEQPNQDSYGRVDVWWKNWTDKPGTVLCELYVDGVLYWSENKTFTANGSIDSSYQIYYSGTGTHTLEARINYANRQSETDSTDNVAHESVTPTKIEDNTYDFSVSELTVSPSTIYQGDSCTVSFVTDNWNHEVAYQDILVEVLVGNKVVKSDYVDFRAFGRNQHTYTLKMTDVGTKTITARINWANRNLEDNRDNNKASTSVTVKTYYDFSVSNLKVEPSTCYEGDWVTLTFRSDNLDPYNAYTNIPLEILYDGTVFYTTSMNYDANSGKTHSLTINAGSEVGTHEFTVRINWANRSTEVKASNNETEAAELVIKGKQDLTIEAIAPNSDYRAGVTVVTSYRIINKTSHDILPKDKNTVTFEAYYYNGASKVVISSQAWEEAVVPGGEDNLVYFKWTVPEGFEGKTVYCTATVNADLTVEEASTANNTDTLIRTIAAKPSSQTPDTQFEKTKPDGYTVPSAPSAVNGSATWSMWVYENGTFVRKDFGISLSATASAQPDPDCPSAEYVDGYWRMGSGYGFYIGVVPKFVANGTAILPDSTAYTSAQQGFAMFPEFDYSTATNYYRTLKATGNKWHFVPNPYADGQEPFHFTPLWFPNGDYTVAITLTDVWTPAGMISCTANTNTIKIVNSAYDDWYVGEA